MENFIIQINDWYWKKNGWGRVIYVEDINKYLPFSKELLNSGCFNEDPDFSENSVSNEIIEENENILEHMKLENSNNILIEHEVENTEHEGQNTEH